MFCRRWTVQFTGQPRRQVGSASGHRAFALPVFLLLIPPERVVRNIGWCCRIPCHCDQIADGDVAARARQEASTHERMRHCLAATLEALFDENCFVGPGEHARHDVETIEELQRPSILDRLGRDNRIPAARVHLMHQSGTLHEIDAREVHHREIDPVVHVQQHIEITRQHTEGRAAGTERRDARPPAAEQQLPKQPEVQIHFGKITGSTSAVVKTQRSLWPHSDTMIALCLAPSESFTYLKNASPRARRVGPCAIALGDESNPPSGRTSTWPSRYVVGRSTSCLMSCSFEGPAL